MPLAAPLRWLVVLAALLAPAGVAAAQDVLTATAVPERRIVHPGDQIAVAVVVEYAEHHHSWPPDPVVPPGLKGLTPLPTVLVQDPGGGQEGFTLALAHAQWPAPRLISTSSLGSPIDVLAFEGRIIIYVPVLIAADAPPGRAELVFGLSYQACDEHVCYPPAVAPLRVALDVVPIGTDVPDRGGADAAIFGAFDQTVWARIAAGDPGRTPAGAAADDGRRFDFLGWEFRVAANAYVLILLIAFAAGIIMNFTPCVLPVLPLKVMSLQQQAKTPGKFVVFSVAYCLGIVATFAVLGLMAFGILTGGQKFDWGQIFAYPWFSLTMAAIVAIMALGMMGLFAFRLPRAVYMVNPSHDSLHGNFLFGALTAVLAVPCTGPLLGATLAWVGTQDAATGLATFVVMGAGMAFPYALLLAFPGLLNRLPRSGPGSELLKQVLGILLIAVAAFLATNAIHLEGRAWLVGGIAAAAWLWAMVGAVRMLRTPRGRAGTAAFAAIMLLVTAGATWAFARPGPTEWTVLRNRSDDEIRSTIEAALAQGRTVVVDFTAIWCSNCHVIEKLTLDSETGRQVLARPDVLPVKVDLTTAAQDQGWGVVHEISGGGGIPLIAIFRPGEAAPVYFQSFFKAADLERAVLGTPPVPGG